VAYRIALVGGTGPEGQGLAARFAIAGNEVVIGSRDGDRAAASALGLARALAEAGHAELALSGAANTDAVASCDIAILVVPFEGHRATIEALADVLAGKIVVDAVVPLRFERGPRPVEVAEGSATEQAARLLPASKVVGAFHNLGAEALSRVNEPMDADVLVTGADAEAKSLVRGLAEQIEGVRAVDAGPLRFSRFVEGLTILLIGINGRYKAHTSVRIQGLPAVPPA
jgi:NADPH-dependent F420 reductase